MCQKNLLENNQTFFDGRNQQEKRDARSQSPPPTHTPRRCHLNHELVPAEENLNRIDGFLMIPSSLLTEQPYRQLPGESKLLYELHWPAQRHRQRTDQRFQQQVRHPAHHQPCPAGGWLLHGHHPGCPDLHPDLPARCPVLRYGPHPLRYHDGHEPGYRQHHPARWQRTVQRLLGGRYGYGGHDQTDPAVLCRDLCGADAGSLCALVLHGAAHPVRRSLIMRKGASFHGLFSHQVWRCRRWRNQ